jgi:hypothetical protein
MTERDEEISTAMPNDLDALPRRGGFRVRGLEMTRLESFVDATFAFAVSLLVIAGQQVPDDLDTILRAFNKRAGVRCFHRGHGDFLARSLALEPAVRIGRRRLHSH